MKEFEAWAVKDNYVVDYRNQSQDNRVSASIFWETRRDDFTSAIGLSIEGFGSFHFRIEELSHILKLEIKSQNSALDISVLDRFPVDHIVTGESWIPLVPEEVERYSKFVNGNNLKLGQKVDLSDYLKLVGGKNQNLIELIIEGNLEFLTDLVQLQSIDAGLALEPYPYQKKGIERPPIRLLKQPHPTPAAPHPPLSPAYATHLIAVHSLSH